MGYVGLDAATRRDSHSNIGNGTTMKLKHFLSLKAVISLLFGAILVTVPVALMSVFGAVLDPAGSVTARLLGAMLGAVGLICWDGRDRVSDQVKGITLALFLGDSIGFAVLLVAQLTGMFSALGWANVAVWLLLALGLGYFRFVQPDERRTTQVS